MKKYFWSPHIDPQVATKKSVMNSLNSLAQFDKKFENILINVFGEWDEFKSDVIDKINLISNRQIIKRKFKGFYYSRFLYFLIFFFSYFSLKKIIKKNKPDYLIIHLVTSIPILMFIFNDFKTKLVLRISGFPRLNLLRFVLWKIGSRKIKYVICPTKEKKNFLLKKKIFNKKQLFYIPDPILNTKKINQLKIKPLEHKLSKPYFLVIGRFTKQKNHIFLLNFFSKNSHYLKDYKLIIIGDGELENLYKKIIHRENLNNKIKILSYKENIYNYIYNAECIISSSLWEDPGFIMIESAFIGTPVITSNCPSGPKEFIGNSENGFIYNSNDEISFQNCLDKFLNTSKVDLQKKINKAKKKSKLFTGFNNYNKLSYILN